MLLSSMLLLAGNLCQSKSAIDSAVSFRDMQSLLRILGCSYSTEHYPFWNKNKPNGNNVGSIDEMINCSKSLNLK